MRKKNYIAVLLLLTSLFGKAQLLTSDSALLKILESDVLLPAIIDSAVKNSPLVKRTGKSVELYEEGVKTAKGSILSGVSLLSSYNYGTTGDVSFGKDYNSASQFSNFRSSRGDRYNFGVNVQLPLTYLISRKNTVRSSQLQVQVAEDERDNSVLYVKQEVIRIYQEFKLAQKLMLTSGKSKQVAYVNYSMSNKDFLKGDGDLEQLSRLHDIYSKSSIEYDTYVNRFQTAFLQLQTYAGIELSKLINQVK